MKISLISLWGTIYGNPSTRHFLNVPKHHKFFMLLLLLLFLYCGCPLLRYCNVILWISTGGIERLPCAKSVLMPEKEAENLRCFVGGAFGGSLKPQCLLICFLTQRTQLFAMCISAFS